MKNIMAYCEHKIFFLLKIIYKTQNNDKIYDISVAIIFVKYYTIFEPPLLKKYRNEQLHLKIAQIFIHFLHNKQFFSLLFFRKHYCLHVQFIFITIHKLFYFMSHQKKNLEYFPCLFLFLSLFSNVVKIM